MTNIVRHIFKQDFRGKAVFINENGIIREQTMTNCSDGLSGIEFRTNPNGKITVVVINMDVRRKRLEIQGSTDFRFIYRIGFIS